MAEDQLSEYEHRMSYEDVVLQQERERLAKLEQAAEVKPKEPKDEEAKAKRPYTRRDTGKNSQ